jgi:hypothetical protein
MDGYLRRRLSDVSRFRDTFLVVATVFYPALACEGRLRALVAAVSNRRAHPPGKPATIWRCTQTALAVALAELEA